MDKKKNDITGGMTSNELSKLKETLDATTGGLDLNEFDKSKEIINNFLSTVREEQYTSILSNLINKVVKLEERLGENKKEFDQQNSRNIEIIGLFSSVLALIIINVNVAISAPTFLAAILLVASLTASLLIFASLIHSFFSKEEKKVKIPGFWAGITIFILLIVGGAIFHAFGWDIYHASSTEAYNFEIKTNISGQ